MDELVIAERAHRHRTFVAPAEERTVEAHRGVLVGGEEFIPHDMAGRGIGGALKADRGRFAGAAHDVEGHALRITDQGHPADAVQCGRRHVNGTAGALHGG
jgi:hypothetical protein